jgi:hypothetical protein
MVEHRVMLALLVVLVVVEQITPTIQSQGLMVVTTAVTEGLALLVLVTPYRRLGLHSLVLAER